MADGVRRVGKPRSAWYYGGCRTRYKRGQACRHGIYRDCGRKAGLGQKDINRPAQLRRREPDRDSVRALATTHALDLVRRYLEALPTVMAGGEIINPQQQAASIPKAGLRTTEMKQRRVVSKGRCHCSYRGRATEKLMSPENSPCFYQFLY